MLPMQSLESAACIFLLPILSVNVRTQFVPPFLNKERTTAINYWLGARDHEEKEKKRQLGLIYRNS
jgi:hypothetical protein